MEIIWKEFQITRELNIHGNRFAALDFHPSFVSLEARKLKIIDRHSYFQVKVNEKRSSNLARAMAACDYTGR